MKFHNKKVIIFDLDGTLINSSGDLAFALNAMLTQLQRNRFEQTTINQWIGNGASTLVQRALSGSQTINTDLDPKLTSKALEIFLDIYAKNLCNKTITYPHVTTTLKQLQAKGYKLAIVTNKPFEFVTPILEGLTLDGLFGLILGANSLQEKKPHPLPLIHVCKHYDIEIEEAVMVGDSKNDILAAHACNMQSIGVSYGYNYEVPITHYKPSYSINDFATLLNLL